MDSISAIERLNVLGIPNGDVGGTIQLIALDERDKIITFLMYSAHVIGYVSLWLLAFEFTILIIATLSWAINILITNKINNNNNNNNNNNGGGGSNNNNNNNNKKKNKNSYMNNIQQQDENYGLRELLTRFKRRNKVKEITLNNNENNGNETASLLYNNKDNNNEDDDTEGDILVINTGGPSVLQ